jgi:TPR repeat protein
MKYRFGDGVQEDIGEAKSWLYRAAVQRHEAAIRNLADLFLSLNDTENAKKWYQLGAENGDEYCKRKL